MLNFKNVTCFKLRKTLGEVTVIIYIIPQCLTTFKPFLRSNYGFFYATKTLPLYQKKEPRAMVIVI